MQAPARTQKRLQYHYDIEKALASQLMGADKQQRKQLYSSLYDELFEKVLDHPQLTQKTSPEDQAAKAADDLKVLRRFLNQDSTYLEIGPGDCSTAFEAAKLVKEVIAVDVSATITERDDLPSNFRLVISDGSNVAVPEGSIDLAYSNQLMEHLHPDDALEQLRNLYRALRPGGNYLCITPNRLNGPHDISRDFDAVATGFHLKEYSISELETIFRNAGFRNIRLIVGAKNRYITMTTLPAKIVEGVLGLLPQMFCGKLANSKLFWHLLMPRVIAQK